LREYFISQAIAKDTGLSFSSIQTALTRLKKKGVFPDGRRRIHGYKIPSNAGDLIATENQYKVWKAATSLESLRSSNYVKLAAVAAGVSTVSCQATIKKLRDKGVNIPTQQERCKNQLIYLKKRIWSEGLTTNQLLSPEICESVGVTQYAMRCLITEIRKQGVVVFSESLALEIKQSLPLETFSRHYINCTLKRPRSSIQQALNSLVVRGFIECLNPEAAPSKRVYKRV
jgi:biotin operon repressor